MAGDPELFDCFAISAPGLEPIVAEELSRLGVPGTLVPGGVSWTGTREQLYRSNLWLRTASRLLVRIGEFRARTFFELERHARRLPWERFIASSQPVRLRVTCRKSRLYHEGAVAERLIAALEQRVGGVQRLGDAPAEDTDPEAAVEEGEQAQLLVVRFLHDRCTVSADSSGALLHLRGYRRALARAPLRETLAAATLLASGWKGQAPLLDPMCGSGTIAIEAALLARGCAPGLARAGHRAHGYAFEHWPGHNADLWRHVVSRAIDEARPAAGVPIHASDRDAGAIEITRANAARAGVLDDLHLAVRAISAIEPPPGPGWLVSNPPYGVRVGESKPLRNLYAALGSTLRRRLPGWRVALLTADRALTAQVGIPFSNALTTRNGGIPVRLVVGEVPG